ncbi:MAG: serine hydrolase domain-containing protein [Chloroflexota bacterium]
MSESGMRGVDVARAGEASLDPDGLRRAFGLLEGWIDDGILPGAAAIVTRGGRVAGEAYLGVANRANGQSVSSDTIWSLASVTKPFTATAVMLLVERGALSLDDPVHRLVPEFLDAPPTAFDRRLVTLRHLLAHCSGLPGFSPDNDLLRQEHRPLEDFVRSFGRQPLYFAPGAYHLYSNPGILMAAEVVGRALAGHLGVETQPPLVGRYHRFVEEEILGPLGMTLSALHPPGAWDDRIARVERTGQEGLDWEGANSAYYRSLGIPWGGMFSRPRDLVRFVDLFLPAAGGRQRVGFERAGAVDPPRIVSPATVRQMTSVQFAPPDAPTDLAPELRDLAARTPPRPAVEWGIGWEVKGIKRPHPSGELTSMATYSHLGATGTLVWADPLADLACVLLTNRTLVSGWAVERPRQALFSNAVMAAVR